MVGRQALGRLSFGLSPIRSFGFVKHQSKATITQSGANYFTLRSWQGRCTRTSSIMKFVAPGLLVCGVFTSAESEMG